MRKVKIAALALAGLIATAGMAEAAATCGLQTVDGLDMLIGQAIPSYAAFFGQPPPAGLDVRALVLRILGETP